MKNKELAGIFDLMADGLELKDENRFRINAYRRAARIMDELVSDVELLNREDRGEIELAHPTGRLISSREGYQSTL